MRVPLLRTFKNYMNILELRKRIADDGFVFGEDRFQLIHGELDDWEQHYLPVDVKGKVVLDVGAGQGETAWFYLNHGAACVICVENSPKQLKYLYNNARLHREIIVVPVGFDVCMLDFPFDFMKMDIEGYEECLLGEGLVKPSVLELHGLQLVDKFRGAGWCLRRHVGADWWTCYGYLNC